MNSRSQLNQPRCFPTQCGNGCGSKLSLPDSIGIAPYATLRSVKFTSQVEDVVGVALGWVQLETLRTEIRPRVHALDTLAQARQSLDADHSDDLVAETSYDNALEAISTLPEDSATAVRPAR